jgi:DNA invertase Pin-like site-specific DNA recombinase
MLQTKEVISQEQLGRYIEEAARAAAYEEGFGIQGCDLSKPMWWAAYVRQSLEEQAQNNRVPDYLRTCALEAKKLGVVVPREHILYDAVSGEHLERLGMTYLRRHLIAKRRIAGVIFPALDRLSREPIHIGIFEFELDHFGVKYHYADAPNGSDPMSQMVRQNLAHAAKFVKLANRKNNRGGNIGRVLKGLAPAHRAAYGYRYLADREIAPNGRVTIKKAWWELDELGPDGKPSYRSPAWVVVQMFGWVGAEGRSLHWTANKLNEMGIRTAEGGKWSPSRVAKVVHRPCYTGSHAYNVNARVPNPDRPLGDITAEIKRTLLRPKPREEWVMFTVPELVSEELWQKADASITERGRGRGKQGKSLQALLRNRIFCPRCGKPMVVRQGGHQKLVYYHCSRYYQPWAKEPCNYKRFIPGMWEDIIWQDICSWLRDDAWVEQQLASERSQDENVAKLIRFQQWQISHAQARIAKVQEGFEGSIYSLDEARRRIADYQATIAKAESEIRRLQESVKASISGKADIEAMSEELKALRDRNLDETTFEDKLDIISKMGIRVYPSEDLKSMRVLCQLNLEQVQSDNPSGKIESNEIQADGECELATGCRKVHIGPP